MRKRCTNLMRRSGRDALKFPFHSSFCFAILFVNTHLLEHSFLPAKIAFKEMKKIEAVCLPNFKHKVHKTLWLTIMRELNIPWMSPQLAFDTFLCVNRPQMWASLKSARNLIWTFVLFLSYLPSSTYLQIHPPLRDQIIFRPNRVIFPIQQHRNPETID